MEELIYLLHCIAPLSAGLEAHLRSIIRQHLFRKGDYLLRVGVIAKDIFYIRAGLVRSCFTVRNEDVSFWFMKERDFCISVTSFLEQEPAEEDIVALEDTECWGITHAELEGTYRLFPEFNLHGRIVTGKYYCWSERRNRAILRQTPEDKYVNMCKNEPDLVRRVPAKYLATFLNLGVRSLHLVRKAAKRAKRRPRKG
jgi:CRP-like cAMP-binding protein